MWFCYAHKGSNVDTSAHLGAQVGRSLFGRRYVYSTELASLNGIFSVFIAIIGLRDHQELCYYIIELDMYTNCAQGVLYKH